MEKRIQIKKQLKFKEEEEMIKLKDSNYIIPQQSIQDNRIRSKLKPSYNSEMLTSLES